MIQTIQKSGQLKRFSPAIHRQLIGLRRQTRFFVFVAVAATLFSFLASTFFVFIGIDWLPVKFGFTERSFSFRFIYLLLTIGIAGWWLSNSSVLEILRNLSDQNLASAIEKKFPALQGALFTIADYEGQTESELKDALLESTREIAELRLAEVPIASVLNWQWLFKRILVACICVLFLAAFFWVRPEVGRLAGKRLFLLDSNIWPRKCFVEVIGLRVNRQSALPGLLANSPVLPPKNGIIKVLDGMSMSLQVRATGPTDSLPSREFPESCRFVYRAEDGSRGNLPMNRVGGTRDGFQLYTLQGPPLSSITRNLRFEVVGGDFRTPSITLDVMEVPTIVSAKLAKNYPDYIVDSDSLRWTPREDDWTGLDSVPEGTTISFRAVSNRPLSKVYVADLDTESEPIEYKVSGEAFDLPLGTLNENRTQNIYLCDEFGLLSEQPYPLSIQVVMDRPPNVTSGLVGIGSAITPNAQIPVQSSISDEYGIRQSWIDLEFTESKKTIGLTVENDASTMATIDLVSMANEIESGVGPAIEPGDTMALTVKSEDFFNLRDQANIGSGDRFELEVVKDEELVRILEEEEIGQRRRLEQIYREFEEVRSFIQRVNQNRADQTALMEPGETQTPNLSDSDRLELRRLFAQRAMNQIDKISLETQGVLNAFENIRLQLVNNRIPSEPRKQRLANQVIQPLTELVENSIKENQVSIVSLLELFDSDPLVPSKRMSESEIAKIPERVSVAINATDRVLNQLSIILDALLKFETQNELLEIVRQMIDRQNKILEETVKEKERKDFDSLLK